MKVPYYLGGKAPDLIVENLNINEQRNSIFVQCDKRVALQAIGNPSFLRNDGIECCDFGSGSVVFECILPGNQLVAKAADRRSSSKA
jgi:hypothetical protein